MVGISNTDNQTRESAKCMTLYKSAASRLQPTSYHLATCQQLLKMRSLLPLQEFIDSMLDECAKVGITEIGSQVPTFAWHGGGQNTVEDTLRTAVQYGQETFGQKPRIIFILLPGNGAHAALRYAALFLLRNVVWDQATHSRGGAALPRPDPC